MDEESSLCIEFHSYIRFDKIIANIRFLYQVLDFFAVLFLFQLPLDDQCTSGKTSSVALLIFFLFGVKGLDVFRTVLLAALSSSESEEKIPLKNSESVIEWPLWHNPIVTRK